MQTRALGTSHLHPSKMNPSNHSRHFNQRKLVFISSSLPIPKYFVCRTLLQSTRTTNTQIRGVNFLATTLTATTAISQQFHTRHSQLHPPDADSQSAVQRRQCHRCHRAQVPIQCMTMSSRCGVPNQQRSVRAGSHNLTGVENALKNIKIQF